MYNYSKPTFFNNANSIVNTCESLVCTIMIYKNIYVQCHVCNNYNENIMAVFFFYY